MSVIIYHNPRCSKSRQSLQLLEENGVAPTIVEYLQNPPTAAELTDILSDLELTPVELMRTGEDDYKAAKEQLRSMSAADQIAWLSTNPKVIERPIVVSPKGVRIGRPPENILEII